MNFAGYRKIVESKIADPVVRSEARRFSTRTQLAFLPDKTVGESWFFRLLTLVYYYFFVFFHGFEIVGAENLNHDQGYLLIARHSTHNGEILGTVTCFYHMTGRVFRALIHRFLTPFFPVMRLMGAVPGERESALALLKSGFWVAVIPGGADEGMVGHENAYKVYWPEKRKGFARIAMDADVPIVPFFLANVEEMRWNPFLYFWNLLGLGRLCAPLLHLNIPIISPLILLISSTAWFLVTFIQVPIPAKVTLYIGDPVQFDAQNDSIDDVVERSRRALQKLIDRHQPNGKCYKRAVLQRIEPLIENIKRRWGKKKHHYK